MKQVKNHLYVHLEWAYKCSWL